MFYSQKQLVGLQMNPNQSHAIYILCCQLHYAWFPTNCHRKTISNTIHLLDSQIPHRGQQKRWKLFIFLFFFLFFNRNSLSSSSHHIWFCSVQYWIYDANKSPVCVVYVYYMHKSSFEQTQTHRHTSGQTYLRSNDQQQIALYVYYVRYGRYARVCGEVHTITTFLTFDLT